MPNIETVCTVCQQPVVLSSRHKKYSFRKTGRAYCSKKCFIDRCRNIWSETMRKTNISRSDILSERMKKHNPMDNPDTKKRAWAKLSKMHLKPTVQGGNGKPAPVPQMSLYTALREKERGWFLEHIVQTNKPRYKGSYPTHYKLDIANPAKLICVEVDGRSHHGVRKVQDKKKDKLLRGLGWTVLRFSNREVIRHLAECVQTVLSTI
jgi:hypothetical protein